MTIQTSQGAAVILPQARRQTLSAQVTDILKRFILETPLAEGEPLPSERQLADSLDISRTTLREALGYLLGEQIIERKTSGKLQIAAFDRARVAAELGAVDGSDAHDLSILRVVVEVGALEYVARHATAESLAEIERWVASGEKKVDAGEPYLREDAEFHAALLRAVGSTAVSSFIPVIEESLRQSLLWYPEGVAGHNQPDAHRSITEHRQILEALKRGEIDVARLVLLSHLSPYVDRRWYERDRARARGTRAPYKDVEPADSPEECTKRKV